MEAISGKGIKQLIDFKSLKDQPGEKLAVEACIHKVRKMSGFAFVLLRTGQYVIQSVYEEEQCKTSLDEIKEGCYVRATGEIRPDERAIFKVQEGVVSAFREFMESQGFTQVHTPKIVVAGAEGGANIFKLDYFNQEAYLAQSP